MKNDILINYPENRKTIKRRTWYVEKRGLKIRRRCRSIEEIFNKFGYEIDREEAGIYRSHKFTLDEYQNAWHQNLMKNDYAFFITIKLPRCTQSGFRRTKDRSKAIELYKKLIKELECLVISKTNHWTRKAFPFVGVLEKGKGGFYHVHLAIISTDFDNAMAAKLCESIEQIINKYRFYKTVIDIEPVYDKEGLCAYMVKELKDTNILMYDEGPEIFNLQTWFNVKKDAKFSIIDACADILDYILVFVLLVNFGCVQVLCRIVELIRCLLHKRSYRRKFEIYPSFHFEVFKFWKRLI